MKKYSLVLLITLIVSQLMAQNIPSYVPKNGLVGWWPFNGNANDESGNGNNGTVNGATLTADRNGKAISAFSFNGIDNNISVIGNSSLNIENAITLSGWIKMDNNFNNLGGVIDRGPGLGVHGGYYLRIRDYQIDFAISSPYVEYFGGKLDIQKWYFFASTYDNNTLKIYLNNTLVYTKNVGSGNLDKWDDLQQLNFGVEGFVHYFKGIIDDIAIYNRALTEQEIKQLYEGCPKETAISSSFNYPAFITGKPVSLIAEPQGGVFKGVSVENNQFVPAKAKIGTNKIQYNFKNSNGCNDSTLFSMIVADTVGNTCVKYDTILKIKFKLTTGIKANQYTSLLVYPNPTSDVLVLELSDLDALKAYKYRIMDLLGKEVYNAPITSMKTEIPLKTLGAKGMYVLHILDANNVSIQAKQIVLE